MNTTTILTRHILSKYKSGYTMKNENRTLLIAIVVISRTKNTVEIKIKLSK